MNSEQEILKTIGREIQKIRDEKGLSQMDVAYNSEMSASHLSKIENGHMAPGILILIRIAKSMGVKLSVLLKEMDKFT